MVIGICVVLPVSIVLIVSLTKMYSDNRRTRIILKAIETNNSIDADKLAESLRKPIRSARETLNLRLLRGCICSLAGLIFVIIGFANLVGEANTITDSAVSEPWMIGGVLLAVGVSYLIVYFVTRKQVEDKAK